LQLEYGILISHRSGTVNAAVIYMTAKDRDEALAVARALVDERLIACANVSAEVTSVYRWQGRLEEEHEAVMIAKTRVELVDRVVERVRALHSYECPCVVSWEISAGNPEYLRWLEAETSEP
jgi:periplasmic divalent cation tolerance protein